MLPFFVDFKNSLFVFTAVSVAYARVGASDALFALLFRPHNVKHRQT